MTGKKFTETDDRVQRRTGHEKRKTVSRQTTEVDRFDNDFYGE